MNKYLEFFQELEYCVIELFVEDIVPETILLLLLSTFLCSKVEFTVFFLKNLNVSVFRIKVNAIR